ncbi:MAG: flagellar protein FlgN [Sphingomonadaceae bacterium]|nr:flagellar protein FlgN [Sphingomonadaceae bacterium]
MSLNQQLRENLRQMVAVLQSERHALAALDLDAILGCAQDKRELCGRIDTAGPFGDGMALDEECRGLLDAAMRINEVNRQVRNLLAANVTARLEVLAGSPALYRPAGATYARVGINN